MIPQPLCTKISQLCTRKQARFAPQSYGYSCGTAVWGARLTTLMAADLMAAAARRMTSAAGPLPAERSRSPSCAQLASTQARAVPSVEARYM